MYQVKTRHDRAVDYLNNSGKYSRMRRVLIVAIIVSLYIFVELLT